MSYTDFEYRGPSLILDKQKVGEEIEIGLTVRNTGDRDDEVVQVYFKYDYSSATHHERR